MEFRVARTRDELEAAFSLVHREYSKRGYSRGDEGDMRMILHNFLPQTTTFVGTDTEGRVVTTATIVPDSPLRLPMDDTFRVETECLRKRGRPCEVVMLASELHAEGRRSGPMVFPFFKVMLDYTMIVLLADFLCIAVNPRHAAAFDYLLFEDLGGSRPYRGANNAPSVAKYLNLRTLYGRLEMSEHEIVKAVFGRRKTDPSVFAGKCILGSNDLDFFLARRGDAFGTASSEDLGYLSRCYGRDFSTCSGAVQAKAVEWGL